MEFKRFYETYRRIIEEKEKKLNKALFNINNKYEELLARLNPDGIEYNNIIFYKNQELAIINKGIHDEYRHELDYYEKDPVLKLYLQGINSVQTDKLQIVDKEKLLANLNKHGINHKIEYKQIDSSNKKGSKKVYFIRIEW